MGQDVQAIVLGYFPSRADDDKLRDEDGEYRPGLDELRQFIESGSGGLNQPSCLGFAVAVANVSDESNGEVELPACYLGDLGEHLHKPLVLANKRWKKLSAWAKKHGVGLPRPRLILIQVERA